MNVNNWRRRMWWLPAAMVVAGCGLVVPLVPENISRLFLEATPSAVSRGQFTAIQVDPRSEDSAGPQFVTAADIDGDGLTDLASGWNQSNPVQLHLQRRVGGSVTFETVTLAGEVPIVLIAGLAIADLDADGHQDIIVLIKDTGFFARCRATGETVADDGAIQGLVTIFFGPADPANAGNALAWQSVELTQSESAGTGPSDPEKPELFGYTDLTIADLDDRNGPDIVVAWNSADCEATNNRVDYFANPGRETARQANAWGVHTVEEDAPAVKSIAVADVDRDGDLDVVSTYPEGKSLNVRWRRNPLVDVPDSAHVDDGQWQLGTVGEISTGADVIAAGDIDRDGIVDVVARSSNGLVIQWFKGPPAPTTYPVRAIPWQVFTIAEFKERAPEAIALADVDGDGQLEVIASADGAVLLFEPFASATVYDQWEEILIDDDSPPGGRDPAVTDPNVDPSVIETEMTLINDIITVDLDGDGRMDIVATLDRRSQAGLTNDALIWYRNNGP